MEHLSYLGGILFVANTMCTMPIVLFNKVIIDDSCVYIPTNLEKCFFHLEHKIADNTINGTISPSGSALIPDTSLSNKTLVPPKEWSTLGIEYILEHRELATLNFDDLIASGSCVSGSYTITEIQNSFEFFSVREFVHNKIGTLSSFFVKGV